MALYISLASQAIQAAAQILAASLNEPTENTDDGADEAE